MSENGLIMAKATKGNEKGSQWVFWPVQDPADSATPEELAAMDTQISNLREAMPASKSKLKSITSKLNTLMAAPTTPELAARVEKLTVENAAKRDKLHRFKEGAVKTVKREDVERVERELVYWGKKRRARKVAFENLEEHLLAGMSREDIWEKVGIEPEVDGF